MNFMNNNLVDVSCNINITFPPVGSSALDPWPSESTEQYVTLNISPGQSSFDWGDPLEQRMDSDMFLRPQALGTTYLPPTSTQKKVWFWLCTFFFIQSQPRESINRHYNPITHPSIHQFVRLFCR